MIFVTADDNDGTSDDIFWKVKIIEIAEAGRATRVEAKCEIQWRCFSTYCLFRLLINSCWLILLLIIVIFRVEKVVILFELSKVADLVKLLTCIGELWSPIL